ncbi:MAG: DEAD/DEAH box helicase, partial [Pseudomonadota bacterium]|nr:DEAD/DEAH box helicase [Pseudomonadota bacterium]
MLARMLAGLAPSLQVLLPRLGLRALRSSAAIARRHGRRISVLHRLAARRKEPWLLVGTPEALLQRVPPPSLWSGSELRLKVGDALCLDALEAYLLRTGYILDDRVDEAGEAALRGAAIDLFPAGSEHPYRLDHTDGRITGIRRYDAASQRTLDEA